MQDYTITMYLNQYWKDERLAFSSDDEVLTLSGDFAEKIWVCKTVTIKHVILIDLVGQTFMSTESSLEIISVGFSIFNQNAENKPYMSL